MIGRIRSHVPPLVAAFGAAGLLLAVAAAVNFGLGLEHDLVNLGVESNVPTWFTSMQFLVIALTLSTLAFREVQQRRPRSWALLSAPILFLVLSIDEIAMLHERAEKLGESGSSAMWQTGLLPLAIAGLVVLGAVAAVALWPYVRGRSDALLLFGAGIGILAVAAVVLELAAGSVQETSLAYRGLGFAEEYGEMLAGTLMLWASIVVLRYEGIRLDLGNAADQQTGTARPVEDDSTPG